jgi:deoxyribose-phosphate aldolase
MIAAWLDSTNLKPEAKGEDIRILCEEAVYYGMTAVCIHPCRLALGKQYLAGSRVKLCTVIGFPLGAEDSATKVFSARQALGQGVSELDMVINIGAVKDRNFVLVKQEIESLLELKQDYDFLLKIIVETALLDRAELEMLGQLVSESGADFIKTSTGFSTRGVSLEDIKVIKAHKSESLKIKASGGVRSLDFALQLIDAGVDRIGSSNAATLVQEYRQRGGLLKG